LMLEQGRHPLDVIAFENGFTDRERMRRAFLRTFGQPPQTIRREARERGAGWPGDWNVGRELDNERFPYPHDQGSAFQRYADPAAST